MASVVERSAEEDGYVIRPFEPRDREGFLDLYDQIFGGGSEEWFAWKYQANPYLPEIPIFVAVADGKVVGTRPFLAFRMRAGDYSAVALQTTDTMVHPDHRRRGLFTRMTRRSLEHYGEQEPAFTFNVPNALSRPGYLKLGCEVVGELPTRYRVQNSRAVATTQADGSFEALGRVTQPLAQGYLGLRDRLLDVPSEVTVSRHTDVPAEVLVSLYRKRPPDEIHALRDEQFFEYRFGNPRWSYTTYIARLGGRPVAGVITGTGTHHDEVTTNLVEVVPLVGDDERDRGLAALVGRILTEHAESDIIAFRGTTIPTSLLTRAGFHSDQSVPLSYAATPTVLIACPLPVDGDWRIAGRDLRDLASWHPTFAEHNTK